MFSSVFTRVRMAPQQQAIAFMLLSCAGFSGMSACVRMIADELDASVIVCLRNLFTLALLLPWVVKARGAGLRTQRISGHAWRGVIGGVGMMTWTYSLTLMPLTHATALSFTAPLFSTLFAILYFKERADMRHCAALLVGFAGTLVILRPSVAGFDWASLIVIIATTMWAITGMFVKSLSATEPPLRMVFYMNFFMFLMSLPFGLVQWQMPSPYAVSVLLLIACMSILMHFCMARAYALASVVTLMPYDFSRLIFTSAFAYILFHESSDATSWLGAAIIIASAVYIARRDTRGLAPDVE